MLVYACVCVHMFMAVSEGRGRGMIVRWACLHCLDQWWSLVVVDGHGSLANNIGGRAGLFGGVAVLGWAAEQR